MRCYFDHAATSLGKPQAVADAVVRAINNSGNVARGVHSQAIDSSLEVFACRQLLSDLFNGYGAEYTIFTCNATESINISIKGVLNPDGSDHAVVIANAHNSSLRPLYELHELGIELTVLPVDKSGQVSLTDLEASIKPHTKLIVTTHASNVTGDIVDIEQIGKIAKSHGALHLVDAAQTAGFVPIDMKKMHIDILAFTGHKALMGPQGTGGLCVNPEVMIKPLKVGGSGTDSHSKFHPQVYPTRLEAGTLNSHGIAGFKSAIEHIISTGLENIFNQETSILKAFYNGIVGNPNVIIHGDFSKDIRCPILSLTFKNISVDEAVMILINDFNISIRSGMHCAPLMHECMGTAETGTIRFSFNISNTIDEINYAIKAVSQIANC